MIFVIRMEFSVYNNADNHLERIRIREVTKMSISKNEKAQGLVEYALILVLMAVVIIVILALLGPAIGNIIDGFLESVN